VGRAVTIRHSKLRREVIIRMTEDQFFIITCMCRSPGIHGADSDDMICKCPILWSIPEPSDAMVVEFSLYKILFHFKALLWKSIILSLLSPHLQHLPY